jgi:hypothetical protein
MISFKQLFYIVACILIATSLVACSGWNNGKDNANEYYRSGSTGIEIRFVPNNPPLRIFDDDELRAVLEVFNTGATDIKGGNSRVYLSGFSPDIISGISTHGEQIKELEGKGPYNSRGGYSIMEFKGNIRDLGSKGIDVYEVPIMATVCYLYQTLASPTVCIDSEPFAYSSAEKACQPGFVDNLLGTQGAPVAVTSIKVEPAPRKSLFRISIQNVGGGQVIKSDYSSLDRCNPNDPGGLDYKDEDWVKIEEVKVGGTSIQANCKPLDQGYIKLQNNKAEIYCTLGGISASALTAPMTIKLSYGYRDSIIQKIEIVKTPE